MKILGLKRFTVKLIPHQTKWSEIYVASKKELSELIGDYFEDIQHIGSTSIPGIDAKPIIDIAIGVEESVDINKIIQILEANNYEYRGNFGEVGGQLFVKNLAFEVRTHHVHIVKFGGDQWNKYLRFRDILREDKALAKRYSTLKNELSKLYANNRELYTKSKTEFIQEIIKRT